MKRARDNRQLLLPLDLPVKVAPGAGRPKSARGKSAPIRPVGEIGYYDLVRKWRKVKRHLDDPTLNNILVEDFNKFTYGQWRQPFRPGDYPSDFESCDWRWERRRWKASYWRYVKHAACHWIVNFTLRLAMLVEPNREWRIITSDKHSTVWDGQNTLFDFNFQAMGIPPDECFRLANKKELRPGQYLKTYLAPHYTERVVISGAAARGFLVTLVDNADGPERVLRAFDCDTLPKARAIAAKWVGRTGRIEDRTQQPSALGTSVTATAVGFERVLHRNNRSAADMSIRALDRSTPARLGIPCAHRNAPQLGALVTVCSAHLAVGQRNHLQRRKRGTGVTRNLLAIQSATGVAWDVILPRGSLSTPATTRELPGPSQDNTVVEYEELDNAGAGYLEAIRRPDGRIIYCDTESRPAVRVEVKAIWRKGPNRWVAKLHKTPIKIPDMPLLSADRNPKRGQLPVERGKLTRRPADKYTPRPAKEAAGGHLAPPNRAPLGEKTSVDPAIEKAVVETVIEKPALGQSQVANHTISPVRSVSLRHDLATVKWRLKTLEAKSAGEGLVLTDAQVAALENCLRHYCMYGGP